MERALPLGSTGLRFFSTLTCLRKKFLTQSKEEEICMIFILELSSPKMIENFKLNKYSTNVIETIQEPTIIENQEYPPELDENIVVADEYIFQTLRAMKFNNTNDLMGDIENIEFTISDDQVNKSVVPEEKEYMDVNLQEFV